MFTIMATCGLIVLQKDFLANKVNHGIWFTNLTAYITDIYTYISCDSNILIQASQTFREIQAYKDI
jgi:hypothetical protein